jgi:hypothetical protein
MITLKHSEATVTFTEADVPDAPALRFSEDIPRLNRVWDDDPKHWDGRSPLKIKGMSIPLIYWKTVYSSKGSKWKEGNWSGIKNALFNCSVSPSFHTC